MKNYGAILYGLTTMVAFLAVVAGTIMVTSTTYRTMPHTIGIVLLVFNIPVVIGALLGFFSSLPPEEGRGNSREGRNI